MAEALTADAFSACRGTMFTVAIPGREALALTLTRVERFAAQPQSPRSEPFRLELLGPAYPTLPQATYAFEHPAVGRFDMFIVPLGPVGREDERMRYEAIFN